MGGGLGLFLRWVRGRFKFWYESDPWDFWEVNLENDPGTVSDQEVNGEEINKEVPSFEDPKEEEEEEESSSRSLNKDNMSDGMDTSCSDDV